LSSTFEAKLNKLSPEQRLEFVRTLPEEQKVKLGNDLKSTQDAWTPLPGPQTKAMQSDADILFYGGAAGGGKTDLIIGLARSQHHKSIIFRREATQLTGIIDRMTELEGSRNGFNGQEKIWRMKDRQVEFGSVPNPGDETRYQGRPHDAIFYDEISNFHEYQFRFLMGWLRTTVPGQRCRVLCAGNPPTNSDGDWVRQFWGPWLDPFHSNRAEPGELRWYYSMNGKDLETPDGSPLVWEDQKARPATQKEIDNPIVEVITPKSRTFIPSKVTDNPYLMASGYMSTLQALPEPLRSQMLHGNFLAGQDDDSMQVIPSDWVRAAQRRWVLHSANKILHSNEPYRGQYIPIMTSMGVDVSRGGQDESIIVKVYDEEFYDKVVRLPGSSVPDGPALGAEILMERKDFSPVHVDAIGVGTSVVDWLESQNIQVEPVTGNEKGPGRDRSGVFSFRNMRAKIFWEFRESLDPKNGSRICIPPDGVLLADLCAPRYIINDGNSIQIESKKDLKKRLGRSPDSGDALIYASIMSPVSFNRNSGTITSSGKNTIKKASTWQ